MAEKLQLSNFYRHPRFWRHFILWAVVYVFFILNYWVLRSDNELNERVWEFFWTLVLIKLMIYGSFTVYNRSYLQKGSLFVISRIILIIVAVALVADLTKVNGITIGALQGFWANLIVLPMILLGAFGFKLAYHGTRQLFQIQSLEAKQLESELKLLRSQVNPHFLFNTLNNIYSTNLDDQSKANEMILGLADLLRYQLESSHKKYVSLEQEIISLEHYIDIEKIRVRACDISMHREGELDTATIAPLLLLPFVENAFKYGTGIQKGDIQLSYVLDGKHVFHFRCYNKIVQEDASRHSGGIGLKNVKKRLALLYPGRHSLHIEHQADRYEVTLDIQL